MAKNVLALLLLLNLTFISCTSPPATYNRANIDKAIKEICKKEFNLDVGAYLKGNSLWVYVPLNNVLNEKIFFYTILLDYLNDNFPDKINKSIALEAIENYLKKYKINNRTLKEKMIAAGKKYFEKFSTQNREQLKIYLQSEVKKKSLFTESFLENSRRIRMALRRVILSMDKPPLFQCLIFSDIKETGFDYYTINFIPDIVKLRFDLISLGELQERTAVYNSFSLRSLGDKEGKHILPLIRDISREEFISYLIRQKITDTYNSYENKFQVEIKNIQVNYDKKTKTLSCFINIIPSDENAPDSFLTTKRIIKKFFKIYNPKEIVDIFIKDKFNNKSVTYSLKAFLKEKIN